MKIATICSTLISMSLALFITDITQAQDFNLFEEVETTNSDQSPQQRPGRENRVTAAKPDFTLVGTSRIGNHYSVILADRNGEKLVVSTEPGVNIEIPRYSEYQIVATMNGKVSVRLPDSAQCIDYPESGVRCSPAGNIAELTLPNNPPVAAPQQQAAQVAVQADEQTAEEIEENPTNPFAVMRARAQNGDDPNNPAFDTAEPGGNSRFVPRRIPPSEVPPGQRVVSTPFGDRLVPL